MAVTGPGRRHGETTGRNVKAIEQQIASIEDPGTELDFMSSPVPLKRAHNH
jgi:hypothetical protein